MILNPGVVLTDLSRPYHKSVPKDHLLTSGKKYFEKKSTVWNISLLCLYDNFFLYFLDQSASKLMEIIDKTTNNETGHFYDVDGTKLPFWILSPYMTCVILGS